MATLNFPVFLDNSAQGFYDRLIASAVVPGNGKPDPSAMTRFLAAHPETERAMKIVKHHPPTAGFADSVYSGLNTFYFVNGSGERAPVRWSLTPLQQALPPSPGPDALFDALTRQLRAGPLHWRSMLTVGAPSDSTRDATVPWPADRHTVDAGLLTLDSVATAAKGTAGDINLAVGLVRVGNRLTHRPPPLPSTVGALERKVVLLSELSLYALLLLQPLLGWAMVSAVGGPVVVFGSLRLPRIAPFDAQLFWLLRQAHSVVAYALMAVIAAHISAVLLQTLTLRDRMIERMTFRFRSKARWRLPLG